MATLVELTANIVTSNVSGSGLSSDDLVAEINKVFIALKTLETTGTPEIARHRQSDEPMVLTFSSPIYSQMDISEMPEFEEELKRQQKMKINPAQPAKSEKKTPKVLAKPVKTGMVPAGKAAVKETVASKVAKEKKLKVAA